MEKDDYMQNGLVDDKKPEMTENFQMLWEHIGISNDFIFCKVMQDESLLAELVRMILPEIRFKKLTVNAQYTVEEGMDIHGVRFDIFAMDEDGTVIEIEMQVVDTGHLAKRIRFYGSMADSVMLGKGVLYSKLKGQYVILICPFDVYGLGLHKYTFKNLCVEHPELEMGDETEKIVLNTNGTADDVDEKLKNFLDYVAGKTVDDEYVKKVDEAVRKARQNREWRKEYMTLFQRDLENREVGREEGRKEGKIEGVQEGRKELILKMLEKGQTPEQISSLTDITVEAIKSIEKANMQMA